MNEVKEKKPLAWINGLGLLRRNVKRFRGGLVFKAHRLLYRSTLGLRVIKKKKTEVKEKNPLSWFEGFGLGFTVGV